MHCYQFELARGGRRRGGFIGTIASVIATVPRIVVDPALIVGVRQALRRKYGLVMLLIDAMATMTGRMRRRAYIEIELAGSWSGN
jgi:hypothetical protein